MISTHFSTTSYISSVINKLHENTHKNRIIHFTQKEILTRVTAVSLPIFALLDCIVHTAGILECGVKAVILYASGGPAKKEWNNLLKHKKSASLFIKCIPFWLLSGGYFLPSIYLPMMESETVSCVNTILLSERPKYSKNCTVSSTAILKYIEKQSKKMPEEQNRGMESTLSLLSGAQKYLDQENLFFAKNKISLNMHLTDKLCKKINFLRNHDHYTSIIEKFFCKEVAARLLSLGICLTSLIDTILQITSIATKISLTVVEKLILHKNITSSNMNMFYKVLLSEIRDLFIHIFGIIIGPVIGLISPDHGLQIANPKSTLFDAIRFSGENPEKAILSDVNSLSLGQSILLPLSFRVRDSGHIVYCLIENTPEGYHFSTINTGYGTDFASTRLKTLAYRKNHLEIDFNDCESSNSPKYVANYTFRKLSKEQLTTHIKSIQKLAQKSFDDIKKEAKEKKTSKYTIHNVYSLSCKNYSRK